VAGEMTTVQALTDTDGGGIEPSARNAASFRDGTPWLGKSPLCHSFAQAVPSRRSTAGHFLVRASGKQALDRVAMWSYRPGSTQTI
jgi:hypothetical protein